MRKEDNTASFIAIIILLIPMALFYLVGALGKMLCALFGADGYAVNRNARQHVEMQSVPDIDAMDGLEFEYYVADVLRKNGYHNVCVTKGSGDYGVDIVAHLDDKKYAFQCKCYKSSVGVSPVQEIVAGAKMYNATEMVVVTNSHFTKNAMNLAKINSVQLWDREVLLRMNRASTNLRSSNEGFTVNTGSVVACVCVAILIIVLAAFPYSDNRKTHSVASNVKQSSQAFPICVEDYDFVYLIGASLEAAQARYQDEWVQISGNIVFVEKDDSSEGNKPTVRYWMNDYGHANLIQVVIEMDPENCDVYYEQGDMVTVVGQCVNIDENGAVIERGQHVS